MMMMMILRHGRFVGVRKAVSGFKYKDVPVPVRRHPFHLRLLRLEIWRAPVSVSSFAE
jgi:hypothetical protein